MPAMSDLETLIARLHACLQSPQGRLGLAFFHICFDEVRSLACSHRYQERSSGTLTLIWQDDSITTVHFTDPVLLTAREFPLAEWRQLRYLPPERMRLFLATQADALPQVALFDPAIERLIHTASPQAFASGFAWRLSVTTRTVAHSLGLFRREQKTACSLQADMPEVPVSYASRRLPTAEEWDYVNMESAWYQEQVAAAVSTGELPLPQAPVLFAPDALRSLLHASWLGTPAADFAALRPASLQPLGFNPPPGSALALRYDPLVPWSAGSYALSALGSGAVTVETDAAWKKTTPATTVFAVDYQPEAIHWHSASEYGMRRWLRAQQQVLYIPQLTLVAVGSAREPLQSVVAQGYLFQLGRLQRYGTVFFSIELPALLRSLQPFTLRKAGWNGTGVVSSLWL